MINGKRVAVVMPAYNAEQTLEKTVRELPDLVDIRILVDDYSKDRPWRWPAGSACWSSCTTRTTATAEPADLLPRGAGRRSRRGHHGPS